MTSWPWVEFALAVEDVTGGNVKTLQSDYLDDGTYPIVDQGQKRVAGYTNDPDHLVRSTGPLIVFGDHTTCFKYLDEPFALGADGVKVLRAAAGFDAKFVYRYLSTRLLPSAGYSRHFKFLKQVAIPKPPLAEQRRIADVLDRVDALRAKRREALAVLAGLNQSIFLDMFGDPAQNPRKWPRVALGDLACRFSDGPFGSNLKSSHYAATGVRVVRLQNIGVGDFIPTNAAFVSEGHFSSLRKHECLPGDVLVGTLGDPNLRACIQPRSLPQALNKADCVQVRPDPRVSTSEYLCWLINSPGTVAMAQSLMLGQTRVRISMGRLRGLEVPRPPFELQRVFSERVRAVEAHQEVTRSGDAELTMLFSALQHRAFLGDLR